jgi:hypothetical protein
LNDCGKSDEHVFGKKKNKIPIRSSHKKNKTGYVRARISTVCFGIMGEREKERRDRGD